MAEIEQNKIIDIEEIYLNFDGEPYSIVDQHKIILDNTLPGDKVKVKIVKAGVKTSFAKVVDVLKKSPNRVLTSLCNNEECPGCALKKADYKFQTDWKKQTLSDLFAFDADFISSSSVGYRNKIILPIGFNLLKNLYEVGLYQKNSHDIINWQNNCSICIPEVNMIIKLIANLFNEHYKNTGKILPVCQIFVRGSLLYGLQCGLVFSESHEDILDICNQLIEQIDFIKSLFYEINSSKSNSVQVKNPIFVTDQQTISLSINKKIYKIGPETFFQANTEIIELILDKMNSVIYNISNAIIFDICSGVGVLSAGLVGGFERFCFEYNADSFKYISEMDKHNSTFIVADMAKLDLSTYPNPDIVILDPPRKGVDKKLLQSINFSGAKIILYLSCNALTQKRDLDLLTNYRLDNLTGFDMFPQTPHIESLAVLYLN